MAHGAFGFEIINSKPSFLQKVIDTLSKIGIRENNKPPVVLRTTGYTEKHLQDVSKQSGVSVSGLKKLIHNLHNAPIDHAYTSQFKKKKLKEETPTNSMGQSSTATGPIKTVDPLLKRKPLKRLKAFLKP